MPVLTAPPPSAQGTNHEQQNHIRPAGRWPYSILDAGAVVDNGDCEMNDRELLELAAKAAGIELLWTCGGQPVNVPTIFKGLISDEVWAPLTDDGDALRLAVKLGIDVVFDDIEVYAFPPDGIGGLLEMVKENKDPYAATRRAIVRAAAEIGRGMK